MRGRPVTGWAARPLASLAAILWRRSYGFLAALAGVCCPFGAHIVVRVRRVQRRCARPRRSQALSAGVCIICTSRRRVQAIRRGRSARTLLFAWLLARSRSYWAGGVTVGGAAAGGAAAAPAAAGIICVARARTAVPQEGAGPASSLAARNTRGRTSQAGGSEPAVAWADPRSNNKNIMQHQRVEDLRLGAKLFGVPRVYLSSGRPFYLCRPPSNSASKLQPVVTWGLHYAMGRASDAPRPLELQPAVATAPQP